MHVVLMSQALGTLLTAATADGIGLIDEPSFWGAEPASAVANELDVPAPTGNRPELSREWNACPGQGCAEPEVLVRRCRADRATGWNIEGDRPDAFLAERGAHHNRVAVECGPILSPQLGVQLGTIRLDARGARLSQSEVNGRPVEMRAKVGRRRIIFEWRF